MILITGGAGFIGSALIRKIISETNLKIINIAKVIICIFIRVVRHRPIMRGIAWPGALLIFFATIMLSCIFLLGGLILEVLRRYQSKNTVIRSFSIT